MLKVCHDCTLMQFKPKVWSKTLLRWYGRVGKVVGKSPLLPLLNKNVSVGMQTFLAHPFVGQTEETLQPTKKGCPFPSLNWKYSSPYSLMLVQSTLYITSRMYFLGESNCSTSHNKCCHVVLFKPCPATEYKREGKATLICFCRPTDICTNFASRDVLSPALHNAVNKQRDI